MYFTYVISIQFAHNAKSTMPKRNAYKHLMYIHEVDMYTYVTHCTHTRNVGDGGMVKRKLVRMGKVVGFPCKSSITYR